MPRKILYESALHQFMLAADRLRRRLSDTAPAEAKRLAEWTRSLSVERAGPDTMQVRWRTPSTGARIVHFGGAHFYTRGDSIDHQSRQRAAGMIGGNDRVKIANEEFFDSEFRATLQEAKLDIRVVDTELARKRNEELFHDEWAAGVDPRTIDVRKANEAITSPEMREIRRALGDLRGRRLLDLGCGLGEASVYFALEGADVTATDISPGMLDLTRRLAEENGVAVTTHLSAAEDLLFQNGEQFDIIYAGNILHHVDIAATLPRLCSVLRPDGMFVSWDPVAYNPVINVYRRIAQDVRTADEHPLRKRDLELLSSVFETSSTRFFWLTSLAIFIWMAVVQRRNPNQERYWKKVVDEADRWSAVYRPLEKIDRLLLRLCPPLGYLCWNVVFVGRRPRH